MRMVRNDDDVLTQFLDPKDIKLILSRTRSFPDLLDAVRAMRGEHQRDAALKRKLEHLGLSFEVEEEA